MSAKIDVTLQKFAAAPVHPGLAEIESEVFRQITSEARLAAKPSAGLVALAALASATFGVASVAAPTPPIESESVLSPFGPSAPLAPSTLLADPR